jgi:hypothetical protein
LRGSAGCVLDLAPAIQVRVRNVDHPAGQQAMATGDVADDGSFEATVAASPGDRLEALVIERGEHSQTRSAPARAGVVPPYLRRDGNSLVLHGEIGARFDLYLYANAGGLAKGAIAGVIGVDGTKRIDCSVPISEAEWQVLSPLAIVRAPLRDLAIAKWLSQ